jgi:histidinol dehydrogenase|tara:strand:- start:8 stop:1318 length:1311 start_codon:yes stop_codon:yes gene_type:complete
MINRLRTSEADFAESLNNLLRVSSEDAEDIAEIVREIVNAVKANGDAAVLELTNRLDDRQVASIAELEISAERQQQALDNLDPIVKQALESSINRIRIYHERQLQALGNGADWEFVDDDGNRLGQKVRSMQRVGIYAPGGKAAYPSTVCMTAVPAKVAGVEEIILVVPTPRGEVNQTLLAAAKLCGVDRVFTIGGAQAIAALAYGTQAIPRVDKIVGPGNVYVAKAKALVYGDVGIDMVAGPSELVIVADASANPDWITLDLFAQAEHDEMAQAIVISPDIQVLDLVAQTLDRRLEEMPRRSIIATSLKTRGALIEVRDLDEAVELVNRIAPEHLELALAQSAEVAAKVKHAGAIFIGAYSAEVVGDYSAGPSHVLPTSGTARFGSPLGVYDFQVRSSIIECSSRGSIMLNRDAAIIAKEEGLYAHEESAKSRVEG